MFCPKCGKQQTDDAKFCRGCGESLTTSYNTPMAVFCPKCGAQIDSMATACPYCGQLLKQGAGIKGETSWAWWLLPVFFHWIGGLVAWLVVKDKDSSKARNMLILGIAMLFIHIVLGVVFGILIAVCTYSSDPYYYG